MGGILIHTVELEAGPNILTNPSHSHSHSQPDTQTDIPPMQNEPSLTLLTVSFWFCTINAQLFTHISTVEVNTFKIDSSRLFLCVIQLLILFYLCFCIETSEQCNQFVVCIDTKPEREGLSCVGCKMVVV